MSFVRRLMGIVTGAGYRTKGLQSGEPGSRSYRSAVPVTMDTALQLSAIWACTRIIAEAIGSMPLNVYRVDQATGERTLARDHYLYHLFKGKVNRWQTRQEYFESIAYQLVLLGNDYSAIQRNGRGEPIALIPLMSKQMEVALEDSGERLYRYTDGANVNIYAEQTIWHNKIFGNGIVGLSPLDYARNSIAVGQASEQAVSKIYESGGKPSGVLSVDKVLSEEQRDRIRQNYKSLSEGDDNRLFVLEAGIKYTQVSLSPQDIELLASRRFQIEDICRFMGVPSILVNDTQAGTTWGSGISQIVQGFYKFGLRPYLERYEASINANLLRPDERDIIEVEFDFNSLLRPDLNERLKGYREAVQGGLMAPNEGRKMEGWQPKEGGDSLYMQQQMIKLENRNED